MKGNVETKLRHRSFRLTIELGDRKLKPHLQTAEWSLDLFGVACTVPLMLGVILAVQDLPLSLIIVLALLATMGAWFTSRRLLSRLYVYFEVLTDEEARDFWRSRNAMIHGYPESWLEPLDDDEALGKWSKPGKAEKV